MNSLLSTYETKSLFSKKIQKLFVLLFLSIIFTFSMNAQVISDIDELAPFHEELAAVKKGSTWGFMNLDGEIVIDYRDDLVSSQNEGKSYPMFFEGKCLISKMIEGHYYYGFIDKEGKTVIEPTFLNATNFKDGYALIIKLDKSSMGSNNVLGKKMINLKLEEYVIDSTGAIVKFLDNSRGFLPKNTEKPAFKSKRLSNSLVAVKNKNKKWEIYKFK